MRLVEAGRRAARPSTSATLGGRISWNAAACRRRPPWWSRWTIPRAPGDRLDGQALQPGLTIVARAPRHAQQLYELSATDGAGDGRGSLQLSEALLVRSGVPMGLVIASIHNAATFPKALNRPGALGRQARAWRSDRPDDRSAAWRNSAENGPYHTGGNQTIASTFLEHAPQSRSGGGRHAALVRSSEALGERRTRRRLALPKTANTSDFQSFQQVPQYPTGLALSRRDCAVQQSSGRLGGRASPSTSLSYPLVSSIDWLAPGRIASPFRYRGG
jgi:hypothetical protein